MALIAIAADKGAPGVTTSSVALAAVWPRPVLLAECDPAGGDLVYRLPGADGGRLDPKRGLLSLAVAARHGLMPRQVWEHSQKLHGGLDVLAGVTSAEQGAGLEALWGGVGRVLAGLPQADVIADCGRVGVDGPYYDLLAEASRVVLITRAALADVVRLRERVSAMTAALSRRDRRLARIGVVVVADHKNFNAALAEVGRVIGHGNGPAEIIGGLAYEPKSADQLRGEWGGRLDRSLLIRTAREIAGQLSAGLAAGAPPRPAEPGGTGPQAAAQDRPTDTPWPADAPRRADPRRPDAAADGGPARRPPDPADQGPMPRSAAGREDPAGYRAAPGQQDNGRSLSRGRHAGRHGAPPDEPGPPLNELGAPLLEPGPPRDEPGMPRDEPGMPRDEPGPPRDEPGMPRDEPGALGSYGSAGQLSVPQARGRPEPGGW